MDKGPHSCSQTPESRLLSMAIKANVSPKDREAINDILEKAGYSRQRKKYHCTLGFIQKMIPQEESAIFGQKITQELQQVIDSHPLFYEVEKADHIFGHVISFLPTPQSLAPLKEVN